MRIRPQLGSSDSQARYGDDSIKEEWNRVRTSTKSQPGGNDFQSKKLLKKIMSNHPDGRDPSSFWQRKEAFGFECSQCHLNMKTCHLYLVRWERNSKGKVRAVARYAQECTGNDAGEPWCRQCSTLTREKEGTRVLCCHCANFDYGRPQRSSTEEQDRIYVDWEETTSSFNIPHED